VFLCFLYWFSCLLIDSLGRLATKVCAFVGFGGCMRIDGLGLVLLCCSQYCPFLRAALDLAGGGEFCSSWRFFNVDEWALGL
jgi:hypothetical protein